MNGFIEKVLNRFAGDITDRVFLMIQNDSELMQNYLKLVESKGLSTVNAQIGKAVKIKFNLENSERCKKPKSTLIKNSYKRHEI